MFEEAANLPRGEVKAYRAFAFPDALALPDHDPFFSLENAPSWITPQSLQLYLLHDDSVTPESPWTVDNASATQLKAYRGHILSDQYLGHPSFSLESPEMWINSQPFEAYMSDTYGSFEDYRLRRQESTPFSSRAPSRVASSVAGSRSSSRVSFIPSSRASSPTSFISDAMSRPPSVMSDQDFMDTAQSDHDSEFPDPDNFLASSVAPEKLPPPPVPTDQPAPNKGAGKGQAKRRGKAVGKFKITREHRVDLILDASTVESTWTVPHISTAIRIDLSTCDKLTRADGRVLNLDTFIRSEDQDSWDGSSGHTAGDANTFGFFPDDLDESILCRRCTYKCGGVDVCQLVDPDLFAGCERFEPDLEGMQDLWRHELDFNEQEAESVVGIITRFYTRIKNSTCRVKCAGVPVLVRLSNPYSGQTHFVGCSNWSRNQKSKHLYFAIPQNVNADDLRFAMEHDGLLPATHQNSNKNETCVLTVHPRVSLKNCLDTPATRNNAIVVLQNPHNHPMHPKIKPSAEDRVKLGAAVQAVGLTGLTGMKLLNAPSTSIVYNGSRVAEHSPAFASARKVRDFISAKKKEEYPHGMGWDGVVHRMSTREIALSISERYIHSVISKDDYRLVVTMQPQITMHIHRLLYLVIDYTFTRVQGDMDEWEIAGFLDRFGRRITFGSLYCDRKNRKAFKLLFAELFSTIKDITGQTFKLAPFFPDAKCRIIMLDGEVAQGQGFGDYLVEYNNPEISGITTRDPLKMLSFPLKACGLHFERHIDELPIHISKAVIERLKSIRWLNTQEEINEWHHFAAAQTDPDIQNWYRQKLANPWILPSVNEFLSEISSDNWDTTPDHSNLVETAHAGRNAETSKGVALLTGIEQCEQRDNILAAELVQCERDGVSRHRFNGAAEREKLSAQRRIWHMRKKAARNEQITGYEALKSEREDGFVENKHSLERQKILEGQIKSLQEEVKIDKRRTDLKDQINGLRRDVEEEKSGRREWTVRRTEIDNQLDALRSGPLAGTRINGRRPTERPVGEPEPAVALPVAPVSALHGEDSDRNLVGANQVELEYIGPPGGSIGSVEHDPATFVPDEHIMFFDGPENNGVVVAGDPATYPSDELMYFFDQPENGGTANTPTTYDLYGAYSMAQENWNAEFATTLGNELQDGGSSHRYAAGTFEDPFAAAALDQRTLQYYSAKPDMEDSAYLESGEFDFLTSYLANTSAAASGLGDSNVDNSSPNFDDQLHNAGPTYNLPHSAPLTASSPPIPPTPVEVEAMEKRVTRKRKSEVDVNDIIPGGRSSRLRTKNPKVRADM
ncbi:hypothetical protein B0H16DRAFT_1892739 [Mycena metata]|uniref:Uncharacterized protein n=1 Tax=Mycena metata TaxID=1033252 RepID=A0AAD7MV74_9AGAR|nr:hypothetical protein B0H16DRAFT_1892738 [Mycena metata]KAJ7733648.1 hypothetical protein B0H16DRAFT_1892739 [Mycena metata]